MNLSDIHYYKFEKKVQKIVMAVAGCGITANAIALATFEPTRVLADTQKKKVKIAKTKKKKEKRSTSKVSTKTVAQVKNAELQKKAEEDAKVEQEAKDKLAEEKTQKETENTATQSISDGSETTTSDNNETSTNSTWTGAKLSASAGTVTGPSGKETYYNLDMSGVISIMRGIGNTDKYWIRSDGVKMLGNYVIVAADLSIRPRGTLVETSLGTGIVCDTGSFIYSNPTQLDIATNW